MPRESAAAQRTVQNALHEFKHGKLKSGKGGVVRSREQAIAIGLSEARAKGQKVAGKKRTRSA